MRAGKGVVGGAFVPGARHVTLTASEVLVGASPLKPEIVRGLDIAGEVVAWRGAAAIRR